MRPSNSRACRSGIRPFAIDQDRERHMVLTRPGKHFFVDAQISKNRLRKAVRTTFSRHNGFFASDRRRRFVYYSTGPNGSNRGFDPNTQEAGVVLVSVFPCIVGSVLVRVPPLSVPETSIR